MDCTNGSPGVCSGMGSLAESNVGSLVESTMGSIRVHNGLRKDVYNGCTAGSILASTLSLQWTVQWRLPWFVQEPSVPFAYPAIDSIVE
eukprot:7454240-Lingulodinium_polyedra.AAC.1